MIQFKVFADKDNPRGTASIRVVGLLTGVGVRKGLSLYGRMLTKYARDQITKGPKSGKKYTLYRNGRKFTHQASAPGEFPANLTGKLRKGMSARLRGGDEIEFGSTTSYARALEFGLGRIKRPRALVKQTIEDTASKGSALIQSEIQKAMTRPTAGELNAALDAKWGV